MQAAFLHAMLAPFFMTCYATYMTQSIINIRSIFRTFLLAAVLSATAVVPTIGRAEGGEAVSNQPLVTIRFNQPRVYFDQQLYSAISKAVAVKPEVMFDVVSIAPSVGNVATDQQWQAVASGNTRAVIASMNKMGVPMSRINVVGQTEAGLHYDETRVFVR